MYRADFKRRARGNSFIPRLWATRKIAYLLSEINLHGHNDELEDEIVFLAKKHGIVTPYTSYLVVEDEVAGGRPVDNMAQALSRSNVSGRFKKLEGGVTGGSGKARFGSPAKPLPAAESGRAATDFSRAMAEEKDRRVMDAPARDTVAYVGEKTFYLTDKGWMDQDLDETRKITEIRYMSEKYFKLMERDPEIGKILALGTRVTFVFEGKAYRIVE